MNKLNLQAFWEENRASEGHAFRTDKPRAPISLPLDDHYLCGVLSFDMRRYHLDAAYREEIHREANDILKRELGRAFFSEKELPIRPMRIEEVFESFFVFSENNPPWLETNVHTIEDLQRLIERVSRLNLEDILLPDGWERVVAQYEERVGRKVYFGTGGRGPATVGTSVIGTSNLCMWMMDYPEVIQEFYELLAQVYVRYARILRTLTQVEFEGWWITDDNSCLFSPKQYERFCAPVLKELFDNFAPSPSANRYQHSDSAMGHLMPILNRLGVNNVNFGPTIHPAAIREAMPTAYINGQLPPLILRNGAEEDIREYVRRDFDAVGGDGGLTCTTAGSIDEGTPFENLRAYMLAVQELTRYDS